MKLCCKCKTRPRRSPKQYYCLECHGQWMNEHRPAYASLTEEQKIKKRARSTATTAKREGRLAPQPCEVCSSTEDLEMHHDDYSKPLEVRWRCRPHHVALELEKRGHEAAT